MNNKLYLLLAVCIFSGACSDKALESMATPAGLTGTWIEKTNRKDTLVFNQAIAAGLTEGNLLVKRGKELTAEGYLLPKIGSGLYTYYIKDDEIYLLNMLSSSSVYTSYPIGQSQGELKVGNFFELGFNKPHTAIRTFVRL
ncbi:hypothetical protein [Arsenicibacter rosenii]|uniref:Lipocalin-like domain-containing protein n=1 Tax=Arsenicibacter rosenii TaxID=1750698 RepID=A0A1S2VDZ2_9BACT|nr:hypothetical protein [Arsenicibacter rosenii]OIN56943.1 hypothetical protein BLX24_22530 [Arsenicibacter rosenii]